MLQEAQQVTQVVAELTHPVSSPFTMSGSVSTASASLSVPTMNVKHEDVIACTKD